MSEHPPQDGTFVQSLERGLGVMLALSTPDPQTLSDVARATGLSRAAARRFLLTLERLGYVRQRDGRFALTPRTLELGHAYLSSLPLPQVAEPHLEALVREVGESSSLAILDGPDIVYVARVTARRITAIAISVGTRFPAYATSMGRVLLAGLEDDDLETRLEGVELRPVTEATLVTREALDAELERARRRGFVLVDQELEVGLRSLAVPVRDREGVVVAAINVSTQAARLGRGVMRRDLLPPLLAAAAAIERDLSA